MRSLVSILAVVVLFLSTQCMSIPGNPVHGAVGAKESCCSSKESCEIPSTEDPEEDCAAGDAEKDCKDACNPFMACCGCLYDSVIKQDLHIHGQPELSVKNGYKEIHFYSAYILSLWHPPEPA